MKNEYNLPMQTEKNKEQGGVSHCGLAIYIFKKNLKSKEELWKLKYIPRCKKNKSSKNPLKETKPKSLKIL